MKSRNLIPGWPRGRSTSRPLAQGSVWPWVAVYEMIGGNFIGVFPRMELKGLSRRPWPVDSKTLHLDHAARMEERVGQQAEGRRKADMTESYYAEVMFRVHRGFPPGVWRIAIREVLPR